MLPALVLLLAPSVSPPCPGRQLRGGPDGRVSHGGDGAGGSRVHSCFPTRVLCCLFAGVLWAWSGRGSCFCARPGQCRPTSPPRLEPSRRGSSTVTQGPRGVRQLAPKGCGVGVSAPFPGRVRSWARAVPLGADSGAQGVSVWKGTGAGPCSHSCTRGPGSLLQLQGLVCAPPADLLLRPTSQQVMNASGG